jgi:two-component system, cell cycle response regulator
VVVRILIADDDALSRRILEVTLRRLGHDVVTVEDGTMALTALLHDDGPRMAILDWVMPGADGLAVCHAVRERSAKYVYLILLTAHDRREDMVAGLEAGADDFLFKPCHESELQARLRSGGRVLELQERLLRAQEALRLEATRDHLTGLWNRRMILDQLHRELRRAAHEHRPLAVVMVDLDHFKVLNDTRGHAAGDEVLQEAARRIRSAMRDYDFIGRFGGEEFLLLLPGCGAASAANVAERVRAGIAAKPARIGDAVLPVSASLGVAWTTSGGIGPNVLIQEADEALYKAKTLGRNRVEVCATGTT